MEEYESRIQNLTSQLDHQLEMHRELAHRAKRYETDACDLDSKLHSAEGELAAGDVLRDGMKCDKERVSVWMMMMMIAWWGFLLFPCVCVRIIVLHCIVLY